MGYTKQQFVEAAFEELGLADYVHDLETDDLQAAVRRLDSMMAEWNAKGIRLSYPLVNNPENTSLTTETTVPDEANEAIITSLAIRLAPSFGKTVSQDTKMVAKQGYNTLMSRAALPDEMQFQSTLPLGAGNKPWRQNTSRFFGPAADAVKSGVDGDLDYYQE